jgi:hydroxymethylbilane synthase
MILRPDGSEVHETARKGAVQDGPALGADAARELKARAATGFFAAG